MDKKGNHHRPHIGIYGNTNRGKSTLANALLRQNYAIVSPQAGTTTDPVRKTTELFGVGPVVIIDTAGIDDRSELGIQRIEKTKLTLDQIDLALLLLENNTLSPEEETLINQFTNEHIPFLLIHGKNDLVPLSKTFENRMSGYNAPLLPFAHENGELLEAIEDSMVKLMPTSAFHTTSLLGGIVKPNELIMLVTPIDSEAPEGRIILPQVQTIRSILDEHACAIVLQETELEHFFSTQKCIPNLIITDSQVFGKVNKLVPPTLPLTSFSILLAHHKGDFNTYLKGTPKLSALEDGDRILILESCTHQISCEDIGRVKLPQWIDNFTKKNLHYDIVSGLDAMPRDFSEYALILQCGACMITQNQLKKRLRKAIHLGVAVTNYGMAIAYIHGIYNRVVAPFV